MLKNYCKIAWRNLIKNRTFSLINLVGLSCSIAFCLLLYFYIRYEQSFDSFHTKQDRIFRLEMTSRFTSHDDTAAKSFLSFLTKNDDVENQLVFPAVVAGNMQRTFPQIRNVVRMKDQGSQVVKVNNRVFKEEHSLYVDSNFFDMFSFKLLQGSRKALQGNSNVVLSASLAHKYFGAGNAVGKVIQLISDTVMLYTVAAVVENAPDNSSIQYGMILPIQSDPDYQGQMESGFNTSSMLYMVELQQSVSWKSFEANMNKWVDVYYTKPFIQEYGEYYKDFDFSKFHWYLRPLAKCHYNASQPWGHYTDAKSIYLLFCLVIVILLIASLNYILLVISNAAARTQEIGVRKVMGAGRRTVILQFWVETQLLVILSIGFGLLLTCLFLPLFNQMMNAQVKLSRFSFGDIFISCFLLALLLGIIAGYYPAMFLSRLKPVSILKSFQTFKINPRFSKIMVVIQYTGCVVLMFSAFVINRQMHYISNKDLGFDKEQVLMLENPTYDRDFTFRLKQRLQAFAATQPSITLVSGMNGGLDGSYNFNGFQLNGEQKWLRQLTVDYNFFEMLDIPFVKGRSFSKDFRDDTSSVSRPSVVNETLFKLLGKDAKIGVYNDAIRSTIIGVVKDYNFESLTNKIEPEQHVLAKNYEQYFMFKVEAGAMQTTIAALETEWKNITQDYPFEYTFLDQSVAKVYEADKHWQSIVQASCFFAVCIACLGLFGLSAINAVNRTKEVGIRKVLGAGLQNIIVLLSSGFVVMFAIAIVIAVPLAYLIMNSWLQNFAYRIQISGWMFLGVGFTALSIALLTVSVQAWRVAKSNPVKSLRSE